MVLHRLAKKKYPRPKTVHRVRRIWHRYSLIKYRSIFILLIICFLKTFFFSIFFLSLSFLFFPLFTTIFLYLLVADTQLYKRLCPSVCPSVGWLVRGDRVGKCENAHFRPCPPVRDWYWPCIRPC